MNKEYLITLLETKMVSRKTVQKILETIKYEPVNLEELRAALEETKNKKFKIKKQNEDEK